MIEMGTGVGVSAVALYGLDRRECRHPPAASLRLYVSASPLCMAHAVEGLSTTLQRDRLVSSSPLTCAITRTQEPDSGVKDLLLLLTAQPHALPH